MSLLDFIRLLLRHVKLLVAVPAVMAATVFFLTWGQPREYESRTSLYTGLVSGYTIETDKGTRTDYIQINSAFDNLIGMIQSRETIERVSLQLMALHLDGDLQLQQVDLHEADERLRPFASPIVGAALDSRASGGATLARLAVEAADSDSPVYAMLYRESSPFNVDDLSRRLTVKRIGASDLIEMRFTSPDPVLAQTTLRLISDIFMARHKAMKEREASTVLDYFAKEVERAQERLSTAVGKVREFGTKNRVINYYEQTKYIASQKESIDQQIQEEEMKLAAAESAVHELETKIGMTGEILRRNASMLERRRTLADLSTRLVLQEATGKTDPALRSRIASLGDTLVSDVSELYRASYTREGLAKGELVDEWLSNLLTATETRAGLDVLRSRRESYQTTYDQFSPLGATLSSLEREVDIAESEYMELLHSLNQAKMRQQNIELAANLEVVDSPTLPNQPLPSKVMLLIGLALVAGATLSVSGIVGREYLDGTIRTPERGARLSGLRVAGALPVLAESQADSVQSVESPLLAQLRQNLRLELADQPANGTALVVVASSQRAEGKSFAVGRLVRSLRQGGEDVRYLSHAAATTADPEADGPDQVYTLDAGFAGVTRLEDLGLSVEPSTSARRFVFLELPALLAHEIPIGLLRTADVALYVVRANRIWSAADERILGSLKRALGKDPLAVVNGVRVDRLESLVGEVPKKRSRIRRIGKQLAQFNFGG